MGFLKNLVGSGPPICPFGGNTLNEQCNPMCRFYIDESKGCQIERMPVMLTRIAVALEEIVQAERDRAKGF